ncbi:MAG TPA: carbohydrate kinase family protein, partial [Candidatus Eremiobacteraceae bacterium]|nr:carbohydrate kinase family protein [Candidatus Eremiobacteraceae bacterium]
MPEVIVLGDVTIDIVAQLESYPLLGGDVQPLETIATLGGTSLTTAVMLARLGVEAALVARVGPDIFGDYVLAQMEREGLSNRWMER